MTKINLPPKLVAFLKLNKCYEVFLENCEKHVFSNVDYNKILKDNLPNAIGSAFWWKSTKQGYEFWNYISDKWVSYLEQNDYQRTNNKTNEL